MGSTGFFSSFFSKGLIWLKKSLVIFNSFGSSSLLLLSERDSLLLDMELVLNFSTSMSIDSFLSLELSLLLSNSARLVLKLWDGSGALFWRESLSVWLMARWCYIFYSVVFLSLWAKATTTGFWNESYLWTAFLGGERLGCHMPAFYFLWELWPFVWEPGSLILCDPGSCILPELICFRRFYRLLPEPNPSFKLKDCCLR